MAASISRMEGGSRAGRRRRADLFRRARLDLFQSTLRHANARRRHSHTRCNRVDSDHLVHDVRPRLAGVRAGVLDQRFHAKKIPEKITNMLELRGVSKLYSGIPAVKEISFVARAGEVTGYLGPN